MCNQIKKKLTEYKQRFNNNYITIYTSKGVLNQGENILKSIFRKAVLKLRRNLLKAVSSLNRNFRVSQHFL